LSAAPDLDEVIERVLRFVLRTMDCEAVAICFSSAGAPGARSASPPAGTVVLEMRAGTAVLGVIEFCPARPEGFAPEDLVAARLVTAHAALAIAMIRQGAQLVAAVEPSIVTTRPPT